MKRRPGIEGAGMRGKTMKPAVCTGCGRPGKSAQPEYYRCGVCYYSGRARYDLGKADELATTEYNIRLKTGRVVEPGPGGFYWLASSGRQLGGVHNADWVAREMAVEALGGVCVTNVFGRFESMTEFIPIDSIESIVKRAADNGCVCGGVKHIDGGCLCGASPKTSP